MGRNEIPVMRLSGLVKTPRGFRAYIDLYRFDFLRPIALLIHTTARVKMPIQKVTTLNTGATMPLIGLGTLFGIRASIMFSYLASFRDMEVKHRAGWARR